MSRATEKIHIVQNLGGFAGTMLQLMAWQDFRLLRHWVKFFTKEQWRHSGAQDISRLPSSCWPLSKVRTYWSWGTWLPTTLFTSAHIYLRWLPRPKECITGSLTGDWRAIQTPYSSEQQKRPPKVLWKAPIIWQINQEEVKKCLENNRRYVSYSKDWGMQFLPMKYRERQSNWLGKQGLSWHISNFKTMNASTSKVELKSYINIFDSCLLDWYAVCLIIENTQEEHPNSRVNLRSDEGSCYYSRFLMATVRDARKPVGITVFPKPQHGKTVWNIIQVLGTLFFTICWCRVGWLLWISLRLVERDKQGVPSTWSFLGWT